jgi:serine/threonine protein kinase
MGNTLCGHASVHTTSALEAKLSACQLLNKERSTGSSTISLIAASTTDCRDEIELALSAARTELDASTARSFCAEYTVGRIIGHGAYCKVQICTHNQTKQEFAVKAVAKAADLKQREGAHLVAGGCWLVVSRTLFTGWCHSCLLCPGWWSAHAHDCLRSLNKQQSKLKTPCADTCCLLHGTAGVIKEVAIMRMLAGHPCAVQLHEVFEDDSCFYLVSEPAYLPWPGQTSAHSLCRRTC